MAFCSRCGHGVSGAFCASCGQPTSTPTQGATQAATQGATQAAVDGRHHFEPSAAAPTEVIPASSAPTEVIPGSVVGSFTWEARTQREAPTGVGSATQPMGGFQAPAPAPAPAPADRVPRHYGGRAIAVAAAVLLTAAVLVTGAVLLAPRIVSAMSGKGTGARAASQAGPTPSAPVASSPSSAPQAGSDAPTSTDGLPATSPPPTLTPGPAELARAAESRLFALRAEDVVGLRLDGRLIVQLSSKYDGVVDPRQHSASGSSHFGLVDILAEHQRIRSNQDFGGTVKLLESTDFGKTTRKVTTKTVWVTIADPGLATESGAHSWCVRHFAGKSGMALDNVCFPRRLTPPSS